MAANEKPLTMLKAGASWLTVNDCDVDPGNCTTGGNEQPKPFDGSQFCTKGRTAKADGKNFGTSLGLAFVPELNAVAAGAVGFSFDVTGTSPMTVQFSVQSPQTTKLKLSTAGMVPVGGRSSVRFDALTTDPSNLPVEPNDISLLEFDVLVDTAPVTFDYCVANVAIITR
jgi:hypothetical protein